MFEILSDVRTAYRGKQLWSRLKRKYMIERSDYLILMPHIDSDINRPAVQHLRPYLKRKAGERAIVVTDDSQVIASLKQFGHGNDSSTIDIAELPIEEIQTICKYYCMVQFHPEIIVFSFDEPYGSKGLLGKTDITSEDMVRHFILGW